MLRIRFISSYIVTMFIISSHILGQVSIKTNYSWIHTSKIKFAMSKSTKSCFLACCFVSVRVMNNWSHNACRFSFWAMMRYFSNLLIIWTYSFWGKLIYKATTINYVKDFSKSIYHDEYKKFIVLYEESFRNKFRKWYYMYIIC